MKRSICKLLSFLIIFSFVLSLAATAYADEVLRYSEEYKTSVYYTNLMTALEETQDQNVMQKTLAVALSQEGYKNYATEGVDIEQAKADGKLWTGVELRMNDNETGNTEYTRWAQRYVMGRDENAQYADYDWCCIFVSWCLYQAGYYSEEQLKKYYYAYVVDPRIFYDADSWIESFNLNQRMVYYPPKAHHKLDAMPWNTYYNVDIDPFEIPYKPGGLVFFCWNGTGDYYSHVGIVKSYDQDTHVLSYVNGNSDGQVITRQIDLDVEESFRGQAYCLNADRILAYADYDTITPPAPKTITTETPVITWDKGAASGIKIQTNSESIMASVNLDDAYYGSIIESNMVFHEGLLTIGGSELRSMACGAHKLTLLFDDGSVDLTLNITDNENEPIGKIGDADGDGNVTILDATVIQRYLAGISDLDRMQQYRADTDGDGAVTILDATAIQRWLAGLSSPMDQQEPNNEVLYGRAVMDAMVVEEDEVLPLVNITKDDENVIWDGDRVLMLFMHKYPDSYPAGEDIELKWGNVWCVSAGEAYRWIKNNGGDVTDWTERLHQVLGMPTSKGYTTITAIWVDADLLYRPAFVSDPTAQMQTTYQPTGDEAFDTMFKAWFDDNVNWSYYESAYPWTRLGYTYDWADNGTEYGLSEFIIFSGAPATVEYTYSVEDFVAFSMAQ